MGKERKTKLKTYVIHKDGVPAVIVATNKHRSFSKETLDEAVAKTIKFAINLRKKWDDNNKFPYGDVFFKVYSDSNIVKFLRKYGKGDKDSGYKYKKLTGYKSTVGTGWLILLKLPRKRDVITRQCMKYKYRVYEKLQEELAFLEVKARVETILD